MCTKHFKRTQPTNIGNKFTGCNAKRPTQIYRLYLPFTEQIIAYHSCIVNEAVALCNRHLVQPNNPHTIKHIVSRAYERFRVLYPPKSLNTITVEDVLASKRGDKKRTYTDALKNYNKRGVTRRDCRISMFVKYERMTIKEPILKPPRAIQARGPVFNLWLQQWVLPYAKHLTRSLDPNKRFVTKGLDQYELATFMRRAWANYREPIAFLFDHDKFDSRANRYWTRGMHSYIADHYQRPKELLKGFETLGKSVCQTKEGLQYQVEDCVFSGDVTTSDGNSTINKSLLVDYTWDIPNHSFVNGDDSVVMIEKSNRATLASRDIQMYNFGIKSDMIDIFEEIEYC